MIFTSKGRNDSRGDLFHFFLFCYTEQVATTERRFLMSQNIINLFLIYILKLDI